MRAKCRCGRVTNKRSKICKHCKSKTRSYRPDAPRAAYGDQDLSAEEIERLFHVAKAEIAARRTGEA